MDEPCHVALPTEYKVPENTPTLPGGVLEALKQDKEKSEETKKVTESMEKSNKEDAAQQAATLPEASLDDSHTVKDALMRTYLKAYEMQEEKDLLLITMVTKEDFSDNGHIRSRKYFLSQAPNLTTVAKESDLLTSLI